jgi:transposase
MLAHIDRADATLDELTAKIVELLGPHEAEVTLLVGIPGMGYRTAHVILAEIGTDMSRFPTPGHLACGQACAPASTSLPANAGRGGPPLLEVAAHRPRRSSPSRRALHGHLPAAQ